MSVSLGRVCMSVNMWQNTDNEEKTGNKDNVQNRIVPWADMKKGGSRTVSVCWGRVCEGECVAGHREERKGQK